jgi:hypothetical protein
MTAGIGAETMGQESSDIKKSIERAIREGTGQEFLGIVKELKNGYYPEDVAAAAIALYARQDGKQEQRVQRRTLHNVTFIPLKTPETKSAGEKKKEVQPVTKPITIRKEHDVHPGHPASKDPTRHPDRMGQKRQTGRPEQNRQRGQPG